MRICDWSSDVCSSDLDDLGVTRIGSDNWIMAYVHIAHDCVVGNHTVFANASSLAGHSVIDDWVILGGFTLVHQFCQIGAHAFTAMGRVEIGRASCRESVCQYV